MICANLPKDHVLSPMKIYYWPFFMNFSQKVNNPKWPLDDLWPTYVATHCDWLYPMISVCNFHGNTSKYMDTVTMFQKLNQKVSDPKMTFDPTAVEVIICNSTQGSLYPSLMKICQNMWIQWPFLKKTWTIGHWPLHYLWPQVCWGHMCDST